MIYHDVQQGTDAWLGLRLGIPTASRFDAIVTKTGKLSSQSDGYMNELIGEWLIGEPGDSYATEFMERGNALEPEARSWYEFMRDAEVKNGGFCMTDGGEAGASPDGLVGDDGLVEIKTPALKTHVGYMLNDPGDAYKVQVQGQLWVCERDWCDLVSFNPMLDPVVVRFERDEKFIGAMEYAIGAFTDRLWAAKERLLDAKRRIDEQRTAAVVSDAVDMLGAA